jgi:hypothetical protein
MAFTWSATFLNVIEGFSTEGIVSIWFFGHYPLLIRLFWERTSESDAGDEKRLEQMGLTCVN